MDALRSVQIFRHGKNVGKEAREKTDGRTQIKGTGLTGAKKRSGGGTGGAEGRRGALLK